MEKLKKEMKENLNEKGFTLIEMIVVVVIISLMSQIAISNYFLQKRTKEMQFAAQKIEDDIRKTQNYSINIKKFGNFSISGGYGIHFEDGGNGYKIFLNMSGNKKYDTGDEIVESVSFPSDIRIDSLNETLNAADIIFEPPYGKVYMTFDSVLQESADLVVEIGRASGSCPEACGTVTVNSQGKIN